MIDFPKIINSIRHRQNNEWFKSTISYAALSVFAVAGYVLVVYGMNQVFGELFFPTNPILIGLLVIVITLFINPVRQHFESAIDFVFARANQPVDEIVERFNKDLQSTKTVTDVVKLMQKYINQYIRLPQYHIFILDPLTTQYFASVDLDGNITSDLFFDRSSVLVQELTRRKHPLELAPGLTLPSRLRSEAAHFGILNVNKFVPLQDENQLVGWIALNTTSEEGIIWENLAFIEKVQHSFANFVGRALRIKEQEQRIQQLRVLSRIAQGIGFSTTFNDILELIYAQTTQVIPATDFKISLFDKNLNGLSDVFCVEDNERKVEKENIGFAEGSNNNLIKVVFKTGKPVLTNDYDITCNSLGILSDADGIFAWVGVPIITDEENIGVLSLGNRDSSIIYSSEKLNLLQAIADQIARAIVKGRLLEETQQRAKQLATLNEIGISLTSTLDINVLLNRILESAADILNCEAGCLLLSDDAEDNFVYKAAIGPIREFLLGEKLEISYGLLYASVKNKKALIANNGVFQNEWFGVQTFPDNFSVRDVLIVPLQLKNRVIGVIQLINKNTGLPFTENDQEMLMTFANQATIAVENSRLYTMTDQALAKRVAELSVMQRIDRELNARLDIHGAMEITLNWALEQTNLEVGFGGLIEELITPRLYFFLHIFEFHLISFNA